MKVKVKAVVSGTTRPMKDSGVEWIGLIPEKWSVYPARFAFSEEKTKNVKGTIKHALKFFNGTIIPKDGFDADYDEYVAETISNYTVVKPNTIMINGLNLNYDLKSLRVGLVNELGVITSAYLALIPDTSRILPTYATYLFKGYETKMAFHNMGSGIRKTLGFKEFKHQPILMPPLEEQAIISDYLDKECARIDSVIEKTRESIEEYKKLKRSTIIKAVTKGLRNGRAMKDSGVYWLGEIPKDWMLSQIKKVAETASGGTPNSNDLSLYDGNINWVCSYDLKELPIYETGRKLSEDGAAMIAGTMQRKGSVLIAMYGGAGTIGNSGILECEARTNQAICSIHFNGDYIIPNYGFFYIMSIRPYWMIYALGTRKDPNISQSIVRQMPCIIPPLEEQKEIADYLLTRVSEIEHLIEQKELLIKELEKYRQSVIHEYVTGKKEVRA